MDNSKPAPAPVRFALMYHALSEDGGPVDGQDPHYSVKAADFDSHLALIGPGNGACARDWLARASPASVLLTFDDGHLSNYALALPALLRRGFTADFFVNPANVGTTGFADWSQLREMADAGMSIQSHGWDHRYFTELGRDELRADLVRSRETIEDRVGRAVTLLAPPGGRAPAGLGRLARECGYAHVLGSAPGRISGAATVVLPRMAVTAALSPQTLSGWIAGRGFARARARYSALGLAKRLLGNRGYERLRARLLPNAGSPA